MLLQRHSLQKVYHFLFLLLILILCNCFLVVHSALVEEPQDVSDQQQQQQHNNETNHDDESHEEEVEPAHAVLFPSFTLTLGVLIFWILTRYAHALPYTAVLFFIGTLMGIAAELVSHQDHVNETVRMWIPIDSEVLLLVFLPGLIYKDASGLNVHLFRVSFVQCLNFAFPMVLAGTVLTALIAYHIFPYGWSFNLCMTFGSILSATDPVAVAALLNELGAPPRLKVHIGGEALLNDGAAIVFYSIFAARYLYELGIEGLGEDIDLGRGVALFFRKSLGGMAVGIFFGLGLLLILYMLNRRFNREENVVEVTATFAIAYIGFYVAEPVWETSGVISTLATGVLVKLMGRAMVNDPTLMDDFWSLVEHILNTILFALGGTVWGAVLVSGERQGRFEGTDWGYLVLLYVLLLVIRLFLFMAAYPITVRIGLKTNWKETLFQVHGGLRGAVGIALALALDSEVSQEVEGEGDSIYVDQTRKLFGLVGGIAFMTLTINASTAGPLLRRLGLTDSTEMRKKIVQAYRARFRAEAIDDMVRLLTQPRFQNVNFALVKFHVPFLADLTRPQLMEAVERHRETTPPEDYSAPRLQRILPYLNKEDTNRDSTASSAVEAEDTLASLESVERKMRHERRTKSRQRRRSQSTMRFMMGEEPLSAQELRILFISVLRAAYEQQIKDGELEDQNFLAISLESSLDFAADAVSNGEPLRDWDFANLTESPATTVANHFKRRRSGLGLVDAAEKGAQQVKRSAKRQYIERAVAFMAAHRWAQSFFRREFEDVDKELLEAGKVVISESQVQYQKAAKVLSECDPNDVEVVVSHKFCTILLNNAVSHVGELVAIGLLRNEEAEHWIEEIEKELNKVLSCDMRDHPGEVETPEEQEELHWLRL